MQAAEEAAEGQAGQAGRAERAGLGAQTGAVVAAALALREVQAERVAR